jgi:hypothetical protein
MMGNWSDVGVWGRRVTAGPIEIDGLDQVRSGYARGDWS